MSSHLSRRRGFQGFRARAAADRPEPDTEPDGRRKQPGRRPALLAQQPLEPKKARRLAADLVLVLRPATSPSPTAASSGTFVSLTLLETAHVLDLCQLPRPAVRAVRAGPVAARGLHNCPAD